MVYDSLIKENTNGIWFWTFILWHWHGLLDKVHLPLA
jgi:hypothetical protein